MSDLADDPEPLTLRQADQARGDLTQILDELDFAEAQSVLLPMRQDEAFTSVRIMLGATSCWPCSDRS
jgi:hypothetical protein